MKVTSTKIQSLQAGVEPSLQTALVALLKVQSVEVDAEGLIEGLPLVEGILSEGLMDRALHRIGYETVWIDQKKISDLVYPCCILVAPSGYLVLLGRDGDTLQVLDPTQAKAYRSVPLDAIQSIYAKRAFQVLPSTDLLLEKHSTVNAKKHWFWNRLFLQRRSLFEVILASLFANVLAVVTSLFALQVYDRVIPGQAEATLWVLASGVGLAILFEAILRVSRARLVDQVGKEAEIEITSDIFTRLVGMKLDKRPAPPRNDCIHGPGIFCCKRILH